MKMSNESEVIICSNQKCNRTIDKIIVLRDLSITPTEQYDVCPHCFTKLNVHTHATAKKQKPSETRIGESESHPLFDKILDAISNQSQKKDEKESSDKPIKKDENTPLGCLKQFGYLSKRPKGTPIPSECMTCLKMVDCMLRPNV